MHRFAAAVTAVIMTIATTASAEEARFSVERFRPAIDGSGVLDVDSGAVGEPWQWSVGAFANYALNPLVLRRDGERVGSLVAHRVGLDVVAALSLANWVQLGVDVPMLVFQTRDTVGIRGAVLGATDLQAVALGDVRLIAKVRILRQQDHALDLAIIPGITVPSGFPAGDTGNYVGEGQVTLVPELAASRNIAMDALGAVRVAANLGYRLRPEERTVVNVTISHELTWRLGASYLFAQSPLALSLSASGATYAFAPFQSGFEENPLEILAGADYDVLPFVRLTGGVGKGIISGFGTPDFRAFLGARFMSTPSPDRDGDGILNGDDACPDDPEDRDGYQDDDGCPDDDDDGDGIFDVDDKCKDVAEDKDGYEDTDGCPDLDNDGDGIADVDDACPDVKGPVENKGCPWPDEDGDGVIDGEDECPQTPGPASNKGCPLPLDTDGDGIIDGEDDCPKEPGMKAYKGCPDRDGDGFIDSVDKCPDEPETVNNFKDDDGCPDQGKTIVKLTKERIEILDKIYFATARDVIKPRSFGLLDQIATILKTHPELTKVRIDGHTDSDGTDATNLDLSQRRANSVRRALLERGVAEGRLEAVGYGESRPVVDNDTAKNKELNRRVEFVIVVLDGKAQQDTRTLAPGATRESTPTTTTTTTTKQKPATEGKTP